MAKNEKKDTKSVAATPGAAVKPTPEKPEATKRGTFNLVGNKSPEIYPFKVPVPEDYDFKTMKLLKKKDYIADHLWFEFKAIDADNKAAAYRKLAEESKKLGSGKDRAKAKRLVKMTSKLEELKQQLEAAGVDTSALLKKANDIE